MITIHTMPKKFSQVNGFKAPEEWYARVQQLADQRGMTVGSIIQHIFNMGLPLYEIGYKADVAARHEVMQGVQAAAKKVDSPSGFDIQIIDEDGNEVMKRKLAGETPQSESKTTIAVFVKPQRHARTEAGGKRLKRGTGE